MPRPTAALAAAALVVLTSLASHAYAQGQLPPSKYDKLQRTLEDKFKNTPKSPQEEKKNDFIYIDPNKSKDPQPKKSDAGSWGDSIYALISSTFGGSADRTPVPQGAFTQGAAADSLFGRLRERRKARQRARAEQRAQRAERAVPVARPNSYVIQLDPDATGPDIDALLQKYSLKVVKTIPLLGVLTVEQAEPQPGAAPAPAAADAKEQLRNTLEPQIIKDLRAEKIIESAFVNSTLEAKQLPKSKGATIAVGDDVFAWRWGAGDSLDGNWGLKEIRMPPVWGILDRYRRQHATAVKPKVAIIDSGFVTDPSVPFKAIQGGPAQFYHSPNCGTHHGMHVAGIIGAKGGDKPGINGIVPDANMEAVAISSAIVGDSGILGVDEGWERNLLMFDDVAAKTLEYVISNLETPEENLRVINISLGYNFLASNLIGGETPDKVPGLALHIASQASIIRAMANRVQDFVLFVVAAGNDSENLDKPVEAKWASPFAWAATQKSAAGEIPPNIVVVEAIDRDGGRADFSNLGGHVAAPGVDIMSTLAADKVPVAVCEGTSQAAPHVSALAAVLFELAPDKKPAEIAAILKSTAHKHGNDPQAPTIDALEAVAAVAPEQTRLLADLDLDGVVGPGDIAAFSRQMTALSSAATSNAAFTEDLNGDGVIDDNECFWPNIDLNGSGQSTLAPSDARNLAGSSRTDLATMEFLWSDASTPFGTAVASAGLDNPPPELVAASTTGALPKQCRGGLVVAQTTNTPAPTTSPSSAAPSPLVTGASPSPAATDADVAATRAEVEKAVQELRKTHPDLRVTINPATGLPTTVMGLSPTADSAAPGLGASADREQTEEETKRAVEAYFGTGGLSSLYPKKNKSAKPEYIGRRKDPDLAGRYVAQVEQRVDGVPVFGSTAKLNVDTALGVTKFSGTVSTVAVDDTKPKIADQEAIAAARAYLKNIVSTAPDASRAFPLANPDNATIEKPKLIVFDPALVGKGAEGKTRLAWLVVIDAFRVFVDAQEGDAFYYYRDQRSGMVRKIFDLGQATSFPGSVGIDEDARTRSERLDPETLVAFRNAGLVRDYFFLTFGRNSFDDSATDGPRGDGVLEAYVRHGRTQNAYWCTSKSYDCPKSNVMVYGPGYAGALDIVAHEMTHGIIVHEKDLLYLNESGAVNESLADIFGALIEFDARGDGGNWLIGESSPGFSITSPLRSLADPNLRDANGKSLFDRKAKFSLANRGQPDHYSEVLLRTDTMCGSTAYQDNGCVHFNSGILNKMAYLISEGGTHRGLSVKGIGRYKLARVTYRAMTVGLSQSSTLPQASNAFVEACFDLATGEIGGIIPADCEQVMAAQRAVGLEVPSS